MREQGDPAACKAGPERTPQEQLAAAAGALKAGERCRLEPALLSKGNALDQGSGLPPEERRVSSEHGPPAELSGPHGWCTAASPEAHSRQVQATDLSAGCRCHANLAWLNALKSMGLSRAAMRVRKKRAILALQSAAVQAGQLVAEHASHTTSTNRLGGINASSH